MSVSNRVQDASIHLDQANQLEPLDENQYEMRKRRKKEALAKLDNAKFSCFHIRAVIVSGIGFFTDAYDLFIINLAMLMMGCVYYADATGSAKNTVPVNLTTHHAPFILSSTYYPPGLH